MTTGPAAEPKTYRLREDIAVAVLRGRILRRLAPLLVMAPIIGIVVPLLRQRPGEALPVAPGAVTVGFATLLAFIVYRRAMARELDVWSSYRLTLTQSTARRVMFGLPPIELRRSELTRIVAAPDLGLYLCTADPQRLIFVPEHVERFEELRGELGQWASIPAPDPSAQATPPKRRGAASRVTR